MTEDGSPQSLTMDRLNNKEELILAQTTSQCCRCGIFQPSINWVLSEQDNFQPGTNPFTLPHTSWIHEESSWCQRAFSSCLPGCRAIRYVQHSGKAPDAIRDENNSWFTCQCDKTTSGLQEQDRESNVVVTHEKGQTCGVCIWIFPVISNLPYMETKNADGTLIGKTQYVCDAYCFVPKFHVEDAKGNPKFLIRPETCIAGCCVACRCSGGKKGKCCRVPFVVRDPETQKALKTEAPSEEKAQLQLLWSGWKHECCTQKNAYHLAFPVGISAEEKATLIGAALLLDVTFFEQEDDSNNGDN